VSDLRLDVSSEASGWLVRFVHPGFAILKPFVPRLAGFLGLMLGLLRLSPPEPGAG
jgi:hypothetical protein